MTSAWRLREGLRELAASGPRRAASVRRRAAGAVAAQRAIFAVRAVLHHGRSREVESARQMLDVEVTGRPPPSGRSAGGA